MSEKIAPDRPPSVVASFERSVGRRSANQRRAGAIFVTARSITRTESLPLARSTSRFVTPMRRRYREPVVQEPQSSQRLQTYPLAPTSPPSPMPLANSLTNPPSPPTSRLSTNSTFPSNSLSFFLTNSALLTNSIPTVELSSLTSLLAPTAPSSSLLQPPDYKPAIRPHYPGGWRSGVGSQARSAITLAVRRRRGRSGPVDSTTWDVLPASRAALQGATPGALFDGHPGRHLLWHLRRHPARHPRPRGRRDTQDVADSFRRLNGVRD